MTHKGRLYLEKLIKHGFNHIDFTDASVKFRVGLILPELTIVQHKLPIKFENQNKLKIFARDLAVASIVVQGFAIRTLKILPKKELLVKDANALKQNEMFKEVRPPWIHWKPKKQNEIKTSISILQNGLKKKRYLPEINLKFGEEQIYIPFGMHEELAELLLDCLLRHNKTLWKNASKHRKEYKTILFDWVVGNINRYIQLGWLNHEKILDGPTRVEFLIAAIVLMAAGYLPTAEEYNRKKLVKDHRKTGPRHYSYHEILCKQIIAVQSKRNERLGMWYYDAMFK